MRIPRPLRYIGDAAGYAAKHKYISQNLGKAIKCEIDPTHTGRFEWANLDHDYSRNRDDYIQLCHSCHRRYDMGKISIGDATIMDRGGIPLVFINGKLHSATRVRDMKH